MVLDFSLAQIRPKKINKMFLPKKLGFIDVLLTVRTYIQCGRNDAVRALKPSKGRLRATIFDQLKQYILYCCAILVTL